MEIQPTLGQKLTVTDEPSYALAVLDHASTKTLALLRPNGVWTDGNGVPFDERSVKVFEAFTDQLKQRDEARREFERTIQEGIEDVLDKLR